MFARISFGCFLAAVVFVYGCADRGGDPGTLTHGESAPWLDGAVSEMPDPPLYNGLSEAEIDAARRAGSPYWQTSESRDWNIDHPGLDPIASTPGYMGGSAYDGKP